jgi:ankyrin repeat protein
MGARRRAPPHPPAPPGADSAAPRAARPHVRTFAYCPQLHNAAAGRVGSRGHEGVLRLLLAAGAGTDAVDGEGDTALHVAVRMQAHGSGGYDPTRGVAWLLLEAGADDAITNGQGLTAVNQD